MIVRLGIPASFRTFCGVARELGAPVLVSANAFQRDGRLRAPRHDLFGDTDLALDSAGFVAMARYWHYPWTLGDYVDLAAKLNPTWWAAPDYCCEPEIARDRAEVLSRVERTAFKLDWTCQVAADRGIKPPMPVLQGWFPDDYLRCVDRMFDLPPLVGVGSVCRRSLKGPAGIFAVLSRLDARLPHHVRLHLFGVKGSAIGALAGHPRIHSIDSMAWDFAARRERQRNGEPSCTVAYRSRYMREWYSAQTAHLGLFAEAA